MVAVPNALLNVPGTPYLARKTPHRAENRSSQLEHASADVRRTALGPFKPHTALGARGAELAFKDQAQLEPTAAESQDGSTPSSLAPGSGGPTRQVRKSDEAEK